MNAGLAASVHARLLTRTKERGEDFNLTLTRYAVERFLYRLSVSDLRDRFWLKGALLFDLWFDVPHRPTRDADLLGLGPQDAEDASKRAQWKAFLGKNRLEAPALVQVVAEIRRFMADPLRMARERAKGK